MSGPLEGLRVIELTHAAVGPWTSLLLGSLGADVIKVDSPQGDFIASVQPMQKGLGVVYPACNLNKRSIILDLKDPNQRDVAYKLVKDADIFIENMRPGVVERLGMGYEKLSQINLRLIYASASGWGQRGPIAKVGAMDVAVQAFSGWTSINGAPGGKGEFFRHTVHTDPTTSSFLLGAILQALLIREKTGVGMRVEVTMLGSSMNVQLTRMAEFFATGKTPPTLGSACVTTVPHQAFLCHDQRWLAVGVVNDQQWAGLCRGLRQERLAKDPRFVTNPQRVEHRKELIPILEDIFLSKPSVWWMIRLGKERVPNGPFLDFYGLRYHAQVLENQYIVSLDIPRQGMMLFGGLPWEFEKTPAILKPAPYQGEHTQEILEQLKVGLLNRSAPVTKAMDKSMARPTGALEGVKVIDITQGMCGPYTSKLLGDAGADVIKIEPVNGDYARKYGPPFIDGESPAFLTLNSSKRKVALDIHSPAGREVLVRLLESADIFLEDLGPGEAERAGFGYERLTRLGPNLVYCAIIPFGERGPLWDAPGSELVIQAMSDYWGSLGAIGEPPERLGADVANMNTAVFAFDAALAALYHRSRAGAGQRISVSMYGTLLHMRSIIWAARSDPDDWRGHCETHTNPRDHGFQTKDRPIYFTLRRGEEVTWVNLLSEFNMTHILENPELYDPSGSLMPRFGESARTFKSLWEEAFKDKIASEIMAVMEKYDAEVIPINDYESLLAHPQVAELGIIKELQDPKAGKFKTVIPPWKLGDIPTQARTLPSGLGHHTCEVLKEAGFSDREILRLRDIGVVYFDGGDEG